MNSKQKEILRVQRSLLSRNIVWSPQLAASLKTNHLLTDSMISEINETQGMENQILVMLDLLPLRTSQAYDKFADALHVSGQSLLADFLREEDISKQPLNVKDLFKRLPFLSKILNELEKTQLENYMAEKIQAAILAHTWQWDTKEKDKALVAKQEQLEQAHIHEQEIRKKQEQVVEAQGLAKEAKEETDALRAELRAMTENFMKIQQQLKSQLDTQIRYSMANDNTAMRTGQRLQAAEEILKSVQDKLQSVVVLDSRDKEAEVMKLAQSPYAFLPEDVNLFIAQFKKLLMIQLKYEDFLAERNHVFAHLGKVKDVEERDSLLDACKDFASKNDEQIQALKNQVARYEDIRRTKEEDDRKLAAAGSVWQSAIMSVMRKQLQDVKSTLRKKDSRLLLKDEEIGKLRNKICELEQSQLAKTLEAQQTKCQANFPVTQDSSRTSSIDSQEALTRGDNSSPPKTYTNACILPPLRSFLSNKTASSHRTRVIRATRAHISVPTGIVAESDTPLNKYPVGLTTVQLRLQSEEADNNQSHQAKNVITDTRSKPPGMGSTLGDLKAMHGHNRFPLPSGGGEAKLLQPREVSNRQTTSPSDPPRRKPQVGLMKAS